MQRRERKMESRGLMVFCQSSMMSEAPPGIYCKEKKALVIVAYTLRMVGANK